MGASGTLGDPRALLDIVRALLARCRGGARGLQCMRGMHMGGIGASKCQCPRGSGGGPGGARGPQGPRGGAGPRPLTHRGRGSVTLHHWRQGRARAMQPHAPGRGPHAEGEGGATPRHAPPSRRKCTARRGMNSLHWNERRWELQTKIVRTRIAATKYQNVPLRCTATLTIQGLM